MGDIIAGPLGVTLSQTTDSSFWRQSFWRLACPGALPLPQSRAIMACDVSKTQSIGYDERELS